jgi:hypothetical protein
MLGLYVVGDMPRAFLRLTCAAILSAATGQWAAAQASPGLPDSLSDPEFWRLFTTMSEESGIFPSENFVSNEKSFQYVIPTLKRTLTPNGAYVGVGPEQNFTYIVNLEPRIAVIVDIRRQNAMQHLLYKALFELSATRAEFVSRLFSRPLHLSLANSASAAELFDALAGVSPTDSAFAANWDAIVHQLTRVHGFALAETDVASLRHIFEAFREAGPDISYAYHLGMPPSATAWLVTFAELQTLTNADGVDMAFLATERSYQWLRSFERRNLVVPVVGDFGGPKALRAVGEYLAGHGATVTAFYVSNVEQYLFGGFGADQRFYRNVGALPIDSTSMFIRSLPTNNPPVPPLLGLPPGLRAQLSDSAGVRAIIATTTDSAGRTVTTRYQLRPLAVGSTSAFTSGVASIGATLDAFAHGELGTYARVSAMTKTTGSSPPQ